MDGWQVGEKKRHAVLKLPVLLIQTNRTYMNVMQSDCNMTRGLLAMSCVHPDIGVDWFKGEK